MRDVHLAFGLIVVAVGLVLIALERGLLNNHKGYVIAALAVLFSAAGYIFVTSEQRWDLVFEKIEAPPDSGGGGGKIRVGAGQGEGEDLAAELQKDDGRRPPRDSTGPGDGRGKDEIAVDGTGRKGQNPQGGDGDEPEEDENAGAGGKGKQKKGKEDKDTKVSANIDEEDAKSGKGAKGQRKKKGDRGDNPVDGNTPEEDDDDWRLAEPEIKPECNGCPRMVVIKAGTFTMGARPKELGRLAHEGPAYRIEIKNHFAIGKYEVTRAQFHRFVTETGHEPSRTCVMRYVRRPNRTYANPGIRQDDEHPVVCVSWDDAVAYTAWLARKTEALYRLPTEAEWEYVARAGTRTLFATGDHISLRAAHFMNGKGTVPVATHDPNPFGVYGMAGNAWELVADCWHPSHQHAHLGDSPAVDESGKCTHRVMKGGAWYSGPRNLRSAARWANPVDVGGNGVGFRVARDFHPTEPFKEKVAKRGDKKKDSVGSMER